MRKTKNLDLPVTTLSFTKKLATLGPIASSTSVARELHYTSDLSLEQSGENRTVLKTGLEMLDACTPLTESRVSIDESQNAIHLNQENNDPDLFCNQVIIERTAPFKINLENMNPGSFSVIDGSTSNALGTLFLRTEGNADLSKENTF